MSVYAITAVRLAEGGRIERAKIRQVDPARNMWIGEQTDMEAPELADLVIGGDIIYSVFRIGGGTASGPKFRHRVYPGGSEGVELSEQVEGMTVYDLEQY